jgi:PEP-CTERM motif
MATRATLAVAKLVAVPPASYLAAAAGIVFLAVPEPGSLMLLVVGLTAVAWLRLGR